MADDDLPSDTGDHRRVTQRALRLAMHAMGKEMAGQLAERDSRLKKLEAAVRLLTLAAEKRR